MTPTREQIAAALNIIPDPRSGLGLMDAGLIQGLVIRGGRVGFMIEVAPELAAAYEETRIAAERAAGQIAGVDGVTAVLTAHGEVPVSRAPRAERPAGRRDETPSAQAVDAQKIPNVGTIVAVASGKGGVGKSTVSVNLALALLRLGKRVGLLDADIYGPSVPKLLNLSEAPPSPDGKRIEPPAPFGLKTMSIGLLIAKDAPAIWRGPVATATLHQMLTQVNWGELDILLIDLPPGTGDIHLSLAQRVAMAGAVIVSTPQDVALIDARRAIGMFRKVEVPVLGIVENMSTYVCLNCGHEEHLFGHGGAQRTADEFGIDFLGEVPLHLSIRETSDAGAPIVASQPDSAQADAFMAIAAKLAVRLDAGPSLKPPPRIVMI